MFAVFLEIIARLSFTFIGIVNKRSRRAGASALGVMGQYAWSLPFFALLGIGLYVRDPDSFHLGGHYWLLLLAWAALCLVINYLIFYLSRFQALIEMGGYKIGFAMLVSMAIDAFWYHKADWTLLYIGGGAVATLGGWLLSTRPRTQSEHEKRIPLPFPLWVLFILSLSIAALAPIDYALYKDGLALAARQPLVHTMFAQTLLFVVFWLAGIKDYNKARGEGQITLWRMGIVVFFVIVAALVQTWSIAGLSVTTIMVLGLLTGALSAGNDILTGEVAPNKRNLASIALVFLGSAMIAVSKL